MSSAADSRARGRLADRPRRRSRRPARNAPGRGTEAHRTERLAELVCSNSFRSDDAETNAVGVIHREMRALGSLIMRSADANQVPAGGALAVDRDGFAAAVEAAMLAEPLIALEREEIAGLPPAIGTASIIATGPLTSPALAEAIRALTGEDALAFFDAIAPIVHFDSIDFDIAWRAVALRQGGPGRHRRRLRQLPDEPRAIRGFRRRADRGAKRPNSANSRARPISTAACRSRSWPSAAARPCATAR